ncbi:conserved Plasmodium protein, unknown function [Plasmodium ovale wallikeri]|uniref:Uncharacterized protein n=2 Tax=Plasmodium ovale TaxID=36330 RepID=A0A1A8YHG7_PLAOA|nr:conserved Plasmodium protein, unknown function [Plasmodium ovale wallikeri]SBT30995.1 conserved Plasmodium protein, unknown function [Plasmodium ovale wallikeri]SBT75210.1 conserved Plasmodium protein, unknown function [Plasmodium ovale]
MKRKKNVSRRSKQLWEEIRSEVEDIALECQELKAHIERKEEERKSFQLSTVVLEKYNSFLNRQLVSSIPIRMFSDVFINSCGFLFTNNTTHERDDDTFRGYPSNGFAQRSNSDCSPNGCNVKNVFQHNVCGENMKIEKNEQGQGKKDKKPLQRRAEERKSPHYSMTGAPNSAVMLASGFATDSCVFHHGDTDDVEEISIHLLREKMHAKTYEHARKKKTSGVHHSNIVKENPKGERIKREMYEHVSNNDNDPLDNSLLQEGKFRNDRDFRNFFPTNSTHKNEKKKKKKYEQSLAVQEKIVSNEYLMSSNSHYTNEDTVVKKKKNELNNVDKCTDLFKGGKDFSPLEIKTKAKGNTFADFVRSIKNIFFFSEKGVSRQNEGSSEYGEAVTQKGNQNILKYHCLVKSRRGKIYICICPNCEKKFYLLIKKSSNKKVTPKVFPPSHFPAMLENLGKLKSPPPHRRHENKVPSLRERGKEALPSSSFCMYNNAVECFYDSSFFSEKDNSLNFCSCYIGMEEISSGFFEDVDMLLYL